MPGRHLTDHHVRHYMSLRTNDKPSVAAAKAAISTASAYRIKSDPRLPSQKPTVRGRRRPDPLAGIFDREVIPLLKRTPQLRAVTIFEELLRRHPDLGPSVRRTLERRVRRWRAVHGPDQEVVFAQRHRPGHLGLSDFTAAADLAVEVAGEPLPHLLYHFSDAGAVAARRRPRRAPTDSLPAAAFRNLTGWVDGLASRTLRCVR